VQEVEGGESKRQVEIRHGRGQGNSTAGGNPRKDKQQKVKKSTYKLKKEQRKFVEVTGKKITFGNRSWRGGAKVSGETKTTPIQDQAYKVGCRNRTVVHDPGKNLRKGEKKKNSRRGGGGEGTPQNRH